ncbi:MAG: serine O-acetyltransferase [Lachnospiraceae bacterium]|nr:serine O-acetyltransferase [Lachnospiraceae bacterium]
MDYIEKEIGNIVSEILEDYKKERNVDTIDIFRQPDKKEIIDIVKGLMRIVYPGYYYDRNTKIYNYDYNLSVVVEDVMYHLNKQVALALQYKDPTLTEAERKEQSQQIAIAFFKKIPAVRAVLETDVLATFDGDPAAKFKEEIIMSYPGLFTITVNRLAHELFLLEVPLIPRIMTEYAHNLTGIDIHPGATIGNYFFIDHGTGIVVGETAIIGEHVKIYQGVTIGALSTKGGQKLRNVKRHPTIEDYVTIYAGASILGGETVIGKNSVIGSNVFITASVPENTKVSIRNQELIYKQDGTTQVVDNGGLNNTWYYTI